MEVPSGLTPKSAVESTDIIFAFRGTDFVPVRLTAAQFKLFIGSGMPEDFFSGDKIATKYLIPARISDVDHEQPTINGVLQNIQIRRAWLRQFIIDLGAEIGWGTGTPAVPLAAPAVSLGAITENSITFSWPAVANAASYDVYKAGVKVATVTTLSYNSSGLTASTSYQHYVRAVPAAGSGYTTGPASNTVTASTTAAGTGPLLTTPALSVISKTANTVNLEWTNSVPQNGAGAVNNYSVVLSLSSDFASTLGVFNGVGNSATATGLTANTTYYFRIRSGNGTIFSAYGTTSATTEQASTPSMTRVTAPAVAASGVTFTPSTSTNSASSILQNVLQKHREGFTTGVKDITFRAIINGMTVAFEEKSKGYQPQPYLLIGYNGGNGKVEAFIKDLANLTLTADYFPGTPIPVEFSYRVATKDIVFKYSTDNGVTYTQGNGTPVVLPDGLTLLLRINQDYISAGSSISEMIHSGMDVDNNVS